jgi:DNA-binding transcriptional ArsR family regulator
MTEVIYAALGNPYRRRILSELQERGGLLAPVEFVEIDGDQGKSRAAALSHASYHFRQLEKAKLVELVRTEPKRGTVKHLYGLTEIYSPQLRDQIALDQIADLLEEGAEELTHGLLNDIRKIVGSTGRPTDRHGRR